MRRAMRSRFWSSVSGIRRSQLQVFSFKSNAKAKHRSKDRPLLSRGAALNALGIVGALEDGVDIDAGSVDLVGIELAEVDEFFDFGDDEIGSGGHHGIEIASGLAIDEIAPAIALPRFDEREIAANGAFEDVLAAVEFARFFVVSNHGAISRGRVERG